MERKKVSAEVVKKDLVKVRTMEEEKKSIIKNVSKDTKVKWDKVKGINGKIVRYKMGDPTRKEELSKIKYRQLYVGIDGNDLYIYYEVF